MMSFIIEIVTVFVTIFILNGNCNANIGSKRVIGGVKFSVSEIPWMVMLIDVEDKDSVLCGGMIISSKAIITGATCVYDRRPEDIVVAVGVNTLKDFNWENKMSIQRFIVHPNYNSGTYKSDIAIIILSDDIDMTKYPPINLPPQWKRDYNNACVAGWRYTIQDIQASEELRNECFESKDINDCSEIFPKETYAKTLICVRTKGKDSCNDAAGKALYTEIGGKAALIGIVSGGNLCHRRLVFTLVSEFTPWIRDNIHE